MIDALFFVIGLVSFGVFVYLLPPDDGFGKNDD